MLALHAILIWLTRAPGVLTGQDDSRYILLGQSLRSLSYVELWRVDLPAHHVYPPGYPALMALTGHNFGVIVALNALMSAAAIAAVALVVRRLWSDRAALLCLAALAVNPVLVSGAGVARSETMFTLLSCLALAFACLPGAERPARLALAAGLSLAAALTRTVGATLLAAIGAHWLLARRWKPLAIYVVAGIATFGVWLWWSTQTPAAHVGESYVADVTAPAAHAPNFAGILANRFRWNMTTYLTRSIPSAMAFPAVPGTAVDNIVALIVLPLTLLAGMVVLWRQARALAIYLGATFLLLLLWPWAGTRFLIPMVPVMVLASLAGTSAMVRRFRPAAAWPAAVALGLVLMAGSAGRMAALVRTGAGCHRAGWQADPRCVRADQASYFAALRHIRDSLPENAVILSAKPEPLFLYTGRRTAPLRAAIELPADSLLPYLRSYGATHVLIGSLQSFELEELPVLLGPNCRALRVRGSFPPRTWLLEVTQDTTAGRDACAVIAQWRAANAGRNFSSDP